MSILNNPIHHIGVATKSIQQELPIFEKLGFQVEDSFIDENQGVRGTFITCHQYRLELLENLTEKGPLNHYIKNRTKMYHIAYESNNITSDLAKLENLSGGGGTNCETHYASHLFQKTLLCDDEKFSFDRACGKAIK